MSFEDLVRRHAGELYGAALLFLGDRWDAEAATREALLRARRGYEGLAGRTEARAWLLRLTMIEARRRSPGAGGSSGGAAAAGEAGLGLAEAVRGLEPSQREALILRDVAGLGVPEAAEAMGIGGSQFRGRLHRARLAVSQVLGEAPGSADREGEEGPPAGGGWRQRRRFDRDHRWTRASLSACVDGELADADRERLEAHASACAECGAALAGLRRTVEALRELGRDPEAPPGLVDAVLERLSEA